ncbi:MAG TPA: ISL3 family transposase [Streptosporangiaceae bacterium]|nr:ISL3 family transposase [Streptosporangiaceae bacterium]
MSVSQAAVSLSAEQGQVLGLLLPCLSGMAVDRAEVSGDLVRVWVHAVAGGAACPDCGTWCTQVHDRYPRRLRDAPAGGRRVLVWLAVRLLVCGNDRCPRARFAEQPEGLAVPYARRTPLLAGQLGAVAAALAGRAGSRLARAVLAVQVSRHTLVRIVMALPGPAAGRVRVLGIDDFALRKGRSYATLLVDMETGRPADVLPDREQATVEEWLRAHPGAEVICRDRGGAYAAAAGAAAPGAVQVADRWHIWHNLCEHAGQAVARHQGCLDGPGCAGPARQQEQPQEEQGPAGPAAGVPAGLEAVIRERHAAVHQLRAAGKTQDQAAAALGLSRQLTGRFWRAPGAEALLKARGTSALDPWKAYLRQRWDAGVTTIAVLHREVTALGYAGSEPTTYAWLALLKLAAPPKPPAPPSKRQVARWMLTDPARLDDGQQAQLAAIRGRCPELDALAGHVTDFAKILTRRAGDRPAAGLDDWLAAAGNSPGQPELASFATGIRRDYQAVRNALTMPWSSGRVEGLNTRTKLIKRQMYGRATFPLLRKRILLTS